MWWFACIWVRMESWKSNHLLVDWRDNQTFQGEQEYPTYLSISNTISHQCTYNFSKHNCSKKKKPHPIVNAKALIEAAKAQNFADGMGNFNYFAVYSIRSALLHWEEQRGKERRQQTLAKSLSTLPSGLRSASCVLQIESSIIVLSSTINTEASHQLK